MKLVALWFCAMIVIVAGLSNVVLAEDSSSSQMATALSQGSHVGDGLPPKVRLDWPSISVEQIFWRSMRIARITFWITILCHILLAMWVLRDAKGGGKWLFVVLVLLGGFWGAIVYALARMGDAKKS